MISLTPQQQKLLSFIKGAIEETGIAPSYAEMAKHMGLASKSVVFAMVRGLEERGRLRRMPYRKRAMEVLEAKCPHCGGAL